MVVQGGSCSKRWATDTFGRPYHILNGTRSGRIAAGTALSFCLSRHVLLSDLESHAQQKWFDDESKTWRSFLS